MIIIPWSAPIVVSTATVIMPFRPLRLRTEILLAVVNLDPTNNAFFVLDTAEDVDCPETGRIDGIPVPPLCQGSFELAPNARGLWRMIAYSQAPTFPSVSLQWCVSV